MTSMIIKAVVTREPITKATYRMKLSNLARCTLAFKDERVSVLINNIDDEHIDFNETKECEMGVLVAKHIHDKIFVDDEFELLAADLLIAKGRVVSIRME